LGYKQGAQLAIAAAGGSSVPCLVGRPYRQSLLLRQQTVLLLFSSF
jgi:hypothetical protein